MFQCYEAWDNTPRRLAVLMEDTYHVGYGFSRLVNGQTTSVLALQLSRMAYKYWGESFFIPIGIIEIAVIQAIWCDWKLWRFEFINLKLRLV